MRDEVRLQRQVTLEEALDHFFPLENVHPRALFRMEQRRQNLRGEIVEFLASRTTGALWLYHTPVYSPRDLIGGEGLAYKDDDGALDLLHLIDY